MGEANPLASQNIPFKQSAMPFSRRHPISEESNTRNGNSEGFPKINNALFGLVTYNDHCFRWHGRTPQISGFQNHQAHRRRVVPLHESPGTRWWQRKSWEIIWEIHYSERAQPRTFGGFFSSKLGRRDVYTFLVGRNIAKWPSRLSFIFWGCWKSFFPSVRHSKYLACGFDPLSSDSEFYDVCETGI